MNAFLGIIESSENWHDIHNGLTAFNVEHDKSAGRLFEEFCKYYYLSEPTVKNDYVNVWLFHELPIDIKVKLNLGKSDHGVDLVLEGRDGSLSVVQCKFKNDQHSKVSWTKDRLANLFAEGDKADYYIVFTSAAGIDKHSESKKANRLTILTSGDLVNICASTIDQIRRLAKGHPLLPVAVKKPRDYQSEAIANVVNGFNQCDRGQLILPCGAGKTLISLWIKEALNSNHTLVLVPSLALLKQMKDEWGANSTYMPRICVCSEKDIDKGGDNTVSHTYDIGGAVSTDVEEIMTFLNSQKQSIVYSTYQSLEKISAAIKGSGFRFDLAICDEAHKTSGSKLSRYGLIHLDSNIPVKKRLYMTATPRVLSSSLKSVLTDDLVEYIQDMGNPDIFGHEFHRMSFKEAIDRGILVDYQIVAIGVNSIEMQNALIERKYVSDNETIDEIANNYAIDKFMNEYGSTHAITFHSSVKKAKAFQMRHLKYYSEIPAFHVNGAQSTNERKLLMAQFVSSSKSIMTNARCLTEGVDVPSIDAVYFCDPKNSKIDIVQATGRALRCADYKGKKFGYVVVPILHHQDDNIENVITASPFKNLISIIRALSSHDERLVDEIKKIKLGKGQCVAISDHLSIFGQLNLVKVYGFEEALEKSLFSQIIYKSFIPFKGFEEARKVVHALNLNSKNEWALYAKSEKKSEDIPANPRDVYKNTGWIGWGDWLGTGTIAPQNKVFLSFEEAREFVRSLKFKSIEAWSTYVKSGKKPHDIPGAPGHTYKNKGWISWGDWLGTGRIASYKMVYRSFDEARAFVHALKIKNQNDWFLYSKSEDKPEDIPANPRVVYKDAGWISDGDWLGTNFIASQNRNFVALNWQENLQDY